jgi:hypothetical protein
MKDPPTMPRKNQYEAADRSFFGPVVERREPQSPGRTDGFGHDRPDDTTTSAPDISFMGHRASPNQANQRRLEYGISYAGLFV